MDGKSLESVSVQSLGSPSSLLSSLSAVVPPSRAGGASGTRTGDTRTPTTRSVGLEPRWMFTGL